MDKGKVYAVDKSLFAWSHSAIIQRQRQQTAKIWRLPKLLQQCQNMWRDKVGNSLLHSIVSEDCFPCQKCKSWATLKDFCSSTVDTSESFRIVYPGFRFVGFIQVRVDLLASMEFIFCKLNCTWIFMKAMWRSFESGLDTQAIFKKNGCWNACCKSGQRMTHAPTFIDTLYI